MIDWVIDNRDPENIDFVLQVGDITEHGWRLPYSAECAQNCATTGDCACINEVAQEWNTFTAQFQRLENAGIPFALVPGNHDNVKNQGGALDGPGFSDYYSPAHLATLPGYLESKASNTPGCIATAWQFMLGPEPVIVIGVPDSDRDAAPPFQYCPDPDSEIENWAKALIQRPEHLGKQVILLHHRLFNSSRTLGRPHWVNIVRLGKPERFAASVDGHFSPSTFHFQSETHSQTGAAVQIFAPRIDWQDQPLGAQPQPAGASRLAVMRFHIKGGQADQLEVRSRSEFFDVWSPLVSLRNYTILHTRNSDADGIIDDLDGCPYYSTPAGGDTDGDGRGDSCECCDVTFDGRVTVNDYTRIYYCIFNPQNCSQAELAACDGNNDQACNVSDLVATNTEIFNPNTSTCARSPKQGK
jgi:hypothetical protein